METIKTTLHRYCFNTANTDEKAAYAALREKLTGLGLKCFETHGGGSHYLYKQFGAVMSSPVELETEHLFNNQWNTAPITGVTDKGLRVFDWAQDYMLKGRDNQKIKRGHWLEQVPEMAEVRRNTMACGYCGTQEPAQKGYVFCPHCLDSEYLEEKQLCLLRMQRIDDKSARAGLSEAELANLLPQYIAAQTVVTNERARARIAQKRASLKKECEKAVAAADAEYYGFNWLMDNGISVENCIYYNHAGRFSFGWQQALGEGVYKALVEKLVGFPYPHEFKCADGKVIKSEGAQS